MKGPVVTCVQFAVFTHKSLHQEFYLQHCAGVPTYFYPVTTRSCFQIFLMIKIMQYCCTYLSFPVYMKLLHLKQLLLLSYHWYLFLHILTSTGGNFWPIWQVENDISLLSFVPPCCGCSGHCGHEDPCSLLTWSKLLSPEIPEVDQISWGQQIRAMVLQALSHCWVSPSGRKLGSLSSRHLRIPVERPRWPHTQPPASGELA